MTTINLYLDTNCNSGTCGRFLYSGGGSIGVATLREAVAEVTKRNPGCVVKFEGMPIRESQLDKRIGGFTRNEARTTNQEPI